MPWIYALFLALCLPLLAHADIYRCSVDGQTRYQNAPCAGGETITEGAAPPTSRYRPTAPARRQATPAPRREGSHRARIYNADIEVRVTKRERLGVKGRSLLIEGYVRNLSGRYAARQVVITASRQFASGTTEVLERRVIRGLGPQQQRRWSMYFYRQARAASKAKIKYVVVE